MNGQHAPPPQMANQAQMYQNQQMMMNQSLSQGGSSVASSNVPKTVDANYANAYFKEL